MLISRQHIFRAALGLIGLLVLTFLAGKSLQGSAPQVSVSSIATPTLFTPSPSPTQSSTLIPTRTATSTPTATNLPQPTATPVPPQTLPPPFELTSPNPTDAEVLHLIFQDLYEHGIAGEYKRQNIDVNNDGKAEIVISGLARGASEAYVAILMQGYDEKSTANPRWRVAIYEREGGRYCSASQSSYEHNLVIADYLSCDGGTGYFYQDWIQKWIKCDKIKCSQVWDQTLLSWDQSKNVSLSRSYILAHVEFPDSATIIVDREKLELPNIAPLNEVVAGFASPKARMSIGRERETYRWDGDTYKLVRRQDEIPMREISRESSQETVSTTRVIDDLLSAPHQKQQGNQIIWDRDGYEKELDRFWGISGNDSDSQFPHQKNFAPQAAAQAIQPDNVIAAVLAGTNQAECRLTVQSTNSKQFWLVGHLDLPCIPNFTRLYWLDIDNDGQDELLYLTLNNDPATQLGTQRLEIFRVAWNLSRIFQVTGEINGIDGVGIRWEQTDDGFDIYTGIAPSNIECRMFSCISLERRWNHIHLSNTSIPSKETR